MVHVPYTPYDYIYGDLYGMMLYYGVIMLIRRNGLNGWLDELLSDPDEIQRVVAYFICLRHLF